MFSLRQSVIAVATLSICMANAFTGDGTCSFFYSCYYDINDNLTATWYTPDGGHGACGTTLQNSDNIVALSNDQYAGGAHCGKVITASCRISVSNFYHWLIECSFRRRQVRRCHHSRSLPWMRFQRD